MTWSINYYNKDLESEIVSRYIRLTELMCEYGPNIGMPHTKPLDRGLFELRLKGREGIARVMYCTLIDKEIYMLHVFIKKTDKIPLKELQLAKKRMKEIKNYG